MIQVTGIVTADANNVLSGSDLQSAPSAGIILFWVASSQADTRITLTAPPNVASRNITPHLRTNGVPLCSDDSPVALPCNGGEQIAINVDIVTGATCGYVAKFIPKAEM
jgi:hypothetical protein